MRSWDAHAWAMGVAEICNFCSHQLVFQKPCNKGDLCIAMRHQQIFLLCVSTFASISAGLVQKILLLVLIFLSSMCSCLKLLKLPLLSLPPCLKLPLSGLFFMSRLFQGCEESAAGILGNMNPAPCPRKQRSWFQHLHISSNEPQKISEFSEIKGYLFNQSCILQESWKLPFWIYFAVSYSLYHYYTTSVFEYLSLASSFLY